MCDRPIFKKRQLILCEPECPHLGYREIGGGGKVYHSTYCKKESKALFRVKLKCETYPVPIAICSESKESKSDRELLKESLGLSEVKPGEVPNIGNKEPKFKGGFIPDDGEKC